jgi:hypothetical protein
MILNDELWVKGKDSLLKNKGKESLPVMTELMFSHSFPRKLFPTELSWFQLPISSSNFNPRELVSHSFEEYYAVKRQSGSFTPYHLHLFWAKETSVTGNVGNSLKKETSLIAYMSVEQLTNCNALTMISFITEQSGIIHSSGSQHLTSLNAYFSRVSHTDSQLRNPEPKS